MNQDEPKPVKPIAQGEWPDKFPCQHLSPETIARIQRGLERYGNRTLGEPFIVNLTIPEP